eukprot:TRINITY_DN31467_c0_g1_i1.p1 TRINITY_DN31467_c0_g1~~TRINITY_DN31467_c0_g1_i1.p1  ORF type:complete len:409 (+),score=47.99 TRINITY_DN31467_c0_g1_i1:86-1228(+)
MGPRLPSLSMVQRQSAMAKFRAARLPVVSSLPSPVSPTRPLQSSQLAGKRPRDNKVREASPCPKRMAPSPKGTMRRPASVAPTGSIALLGEVSLCEASTVTSKDALRHYSAMFEKPRTWCAMHGRSLRLDHIEITLLDFLDMLLETNAQLTEAEKATSAAVHFIPGLSRPELKRVKKALKGFRKKRPGKSLLPLPKELAYGIAAIAFIVGFVDLGRRVLVMFCLKTRPGEATKLLAEDIDPPAGESGSGLEHWSISISPQSRLEPSKTQTWDDCVIARLPFMSLVLVDLKQGVQTRKSFVFQTEPNVLQQQWKHVQQFVQEPSAVMHKLRHGGASQSLLEDPKSGHRVQAELRHKTSTSMRRYGKPGQLQQVLNRKHVVV